MRWLIVVVILIIVFLLVVNLTVKKSKKTRTSNVIQISSHTKKRSSKGIEANKQLCSFCRKKEKKLSFYADEQGRVVGVCQACKPQAERRALMEL